MNFLYPFLILESSNKASLFQLSAFNTFSAYFSATSLFPILKYKAAI